MIDSKWAILELEKFIELSRMKSTPGSVLGHTRAHSDREIHAQAQVVEQILEQVLEDDTWHSKSSGYDPWSGHRDAAFRAISQLLRAGEIPAGLGGDAPRLYASHLHAWVWDAAKSQWSSNHFRDAVFHASIRVNVETQAKTGRTDIREKALFDEAFSLDPPQPGKPRLRIMADDGSKTYGSLHRGARTFAEGCYAGIRKPYGHYAGAEPSADEALEQLAAFSILARWVDHATVER